MKDYDRVLQYYLQRKNHAEALAVLDKQVRTLLLISWKKYAVN